VAYVLVYCTIMNANQLIRGAVGPESGGMDGDGIARVTQARLT